MSPRQRKQLADVADLVAEGSEWWREAADALSGAVPGLNAARSLMRTKDEAGPAQVDTSLVELLTQVKRLAANFDGMADRFAETAAGLRRR